MILANFQRNKATADGTKIDFDSQRNAAIEYLSNGFYSISIRLYRVLFCAYRIHYTGIIEKKSDNGTKIQWFAIHSYMGS